MKRALASLPRTLEGVYHAILTSIDEVYAEDARVILQWMVCCRRPLQLAEVAEILSFDVDDQMSFDPESRVPDPMDALKICSSLVVISPPDASTGIREVRLAHSTVRDFLVAEMTHSNGPGSYLIIEDVAHKTIVQMCLVYLLYIGRHATKDKNYVARFPLVKYAARHWIDHFKAASCPEDAFQLALSLFTSTEDALGVWYCVFNIDKPWSWVHRQWSSPAGPLYYASLAGLERIICSLLEAGVDPNQEGGVLGTPLQAAVCQGNIDIVKILLAYGADVNRSGGRFGSPLMAAAAQKHTDIVELLLSHGADPNWENFAAGNVLLVASEKGYLDIVQLLLDAGADVNAEVGKVRRTALQAAAAQGRESTCRLLVEYGAKVERLPAFRGPVSSAAMAGHESLTEYLIDQGVQPSPSLLAAAAIGGLKNVTKRFLDQGVEVNDKGFHHPLQDTAYRGHSDVVNLWLEHGYNINAQQDFCGTVLHAAAKGGHVALMQQLLDHDPPADIAARGSLHSRGRYYGSVLENGVLSGRVEVVEFLIERGADVNFEEDTDGSALQLAASEGNVAVFKVLLAHGADINAHRGYHGSALRAAAAADCLEIAEELLSLNCEINTFLGRGYLDTALEAAASVGNAKIIRLLLAHGAIPTMDVAGKFYNGPLVTAADKGYYPIVEQLLDAGADVDAQCDHRLATPFRAAARSGNINTVDSLLARGAKINQECLFKDLIYASKWGKLTEDECLSVTRHLLENGADTNRHFPNNGFLGVSRNADMFPLLLAVWEAQYAMVEVLVSAGANVNEQNDEGWAAIHEIMFRWDSKSNAKLCRLLIESYNADLDVRLPNGSTALHLASQNDEIDCMNIILDTGFDVNDRNSLGRTALHTAAEYAQKNAVQILLARGADISIEDERGHMTALDIAEFNLARRDQESGSEESGDEDGSEQSSHEDGSEENGNEDGVVELLRAADRQRKRTLPT